MTRLFVDGLFAGKTALVTGATSGIGRATARRFADAGACVMLAGRRAEKGREAVAEIEGAGGRAAFLAGDVSESAFCDRLVNETVARFGGLDVLFNNAGIAVIGEVDAVSDADWRRIMGVNLDGVFYMARAAVRQMKKRGGGVIVNMGSSSSFKATPESAAYCATKAAVMMLTRCMALDHAKDNIRVNAICPGDVDTDITDAFYYPTLKLSSDELRREVAKFTPMGRIGTVDEIAEAVMFLASDAAAFMTGAGLSLDGGLAAK